jgi:hypothetical protein
MDFHCIASETIPNFPSRFTPLCARFAPGRAARHVLWFFIIGEAMGIGATIPNWSKGWPHLLDRPAACQAPG